MNHWFNTKAFAAPPQYTYGDAPTTLPNVRSPAMTDFDLSLFRNFSFLERFHYSIVLRHSIYSNHVNHSAPNTTFTSGSFGIITAAGDPRKIQMGSEIELPANENQ